MEKHKEYLNKFLVEADGFNGKESTPDAPVVLKLDKDYKANAKVDQSDAGEELKSVNEEDYVAQTILDKVQNIFSYVATQTLYQYVSEPSVPALNGGLNFMLNVPARTLTININDDGRTTKEDVVSLVKVFTGVLKKKLNSKFDVKIDDKSDINMGRLDSNRFDMDVVVNLKTANPNDITDLGDDERIKARK
jgi:hypothetical protein